MTDTMPGGMRGYTLIELLAVVVLLGLLAGIGVPALVRQAGHLGHAEVARHLQRAEREVRAQAATDGGAVVELDVYGFWLQAGRSLQRRELLHVDGDQYLQWFDGEGQVISRLVYDRHGRSGDAVVVIQQSGASKRLRLLGLTGEWVDDRGGAR